MVRRRTVLAGVAGALGLVAAGIAGAAALAERGTIPGKSVVDHHLGRCSEPVPAPGVTAGPIVSGTFDSTYRQRSVDFRIAYPDGHRPGDRLPVCLALHGYGATRRSSAIRWAGSGRCCPG